MALRAAICLIVLAMATGNHLAMANDMSMAHGMVHHPPAIRPSHHRKLGMAGAPGATPSLTPSESAEGSPSAVLQGGEEEEEELLPTRQHHHSVDKSVAGGGVILGGLATIFLVAVFCYIRATGRKNAEAPSSPSG